ncbi:MULTISPECIES: energy transducer TonB [Lysobacteraceae]|uniref:Energy transducer TonB n=1 Tax=Novilysobacter avium TaxID=2781023 RepID=A0A7S6UMN4_9GAMM|nr:MULTISPECIES: energy transducer TonB [Lysobacter]QOW23126.1 energy transducer TonB [Lysobacter avium]QOW25598.1 energy transducer TonB [Lysobacter sp. H23M47]
MPVDHPLKPVIGPWKLFPALSALAVGLMLAGCSSEQAEQPAQVAPTQPMAVETPPPEYPEELACAGIEGEVGVLLTIGVDGIPKDVKVEDTSGHPQLDASAVEAVKGWKFQAGTSRGKPAESPLRVPVKFTAPDMDSERCRDVSGSLLQ